MAEIAGQAWRNHGWIAIAGDDEEAAAIADAAADEHLEVQVAEEKLDWYLQRLTNYGSLFLGEQATVAYGDEAVGTTTYPDLRAARVHRGPVGRPVPKPTYQRLTPRAATGRTRGRGDRHEEHFEGHAMTAEVRLERLAQLQA